MASESKCKKCCAMIVWGKMEKSGRWIPLDPVPVLGGNLVRDREGTVSVVAPDKTVRRYVSHFSTCPDASLFRRPRPHAEPEG